MGTYLAKALVPFVRVSQDACFPCESDPYDSGAPPLVLLTPPIFQDGCDCRPEDWVAWWPRKKPSRLIPAGHVRLPLAVSGIEGGHLIQ